MVADLAASTAWRTVPTITREGTLTLISGVVVHHWWLLLLLVDHLLLSSSSPHKRSLVVVIRVRTALLHRKAGVAEKLELVAYY